MDHRVRPRRPRFAVIAGLRLDTSGGGGRGPRWRAEPRSPSGFKARHPAGSLTAGRGWPPRRAGSVRHMLQALLKPGRPGPLALGLLALAALAVGVAGFEHARLFHRGYDHVEIVGPLFILNAIGSMTVIAMLVFERVWLFVLGALSIVVPSLVSIYISHTSGFFGFREGGYDEATTLIVAAELAATALLLLGAGVTFVACAAGWPTP